MSGKAAPPGIRVALLTTSVEFGGIERVLLNLLKHIDGGVDLCPVVFTRTDAKESSFFDRLQDMGLRCEKLYVDSLTPALILNPIVNLGQAIALIRTQRYDLIHSHGYRADMFASLLSKLCGVPAVATCHGFVATDWRLRCYMALDRRALKTLTRVIAVSESMKEHLLAKGFVADRIDVVTNAVPEVPAAARNSDRKATRGQLGLADDEFMFGYVGRLNEEKGVEFLVKAFAQVTSVRPSRLLVVGDGPCREGLVKAAEDCGVASRIIFTGFQSNTDPWFAAMDAFVLPSLTEGTPMALLEAMARQLPVVASAVGGVPAVLSDGVNGILVPPADAPGLANAMQRVACSSALRQTLAEGALTTVRERYGVRDWTCRVREVYMKVLRPSAV